MVVPVDRPDKAYEVFYKSSFQSILAVMSTTFAADAEAKDTEEVLARKDLTA